MTLDTSAPWIDRFMMELGRLGVAIDFHLIEMLARDRYVKDPDAKPEDAARAEYESWA